MSGESLVSVEDVRFAYGVGGFALSVGTLELRRGEHVACIGPSGTGKTTLVNLMAGIVTPQSGSVCFEGVSLSGLGDRQRRALRIGRIGMVFQEFELLEYLSALENILLPYHVSPSLTLTADVRARASALADATGIGATLRRRPRQLSHGERQRVAICRALITRPLLVLCDEPTGNLDPATAARTLDLLFEQVSAHGATLFMVTHNHAVLDRFDRVVDVSALARSPSR